MHVEGAGVGLPLAKYRAGLAALNRRAAAMAGCRFAALSDDLRVRLLTVMESDRDDPAAGKPFFDLVLENTMEGYFADPIHGGNRSAAGWRMIGFPGCGHDYTAHVGSDVAVSDLVPTQSIAMFGGPADA